MNDTETDDGLLIDFGDLLRSIRAQAWVFLTAVALCVAAGLYVAATTTASYWTASEIMLDTGDLRLQAGETVARRPEITDAVIANEVEVLGSNLLIADLVAALSLDTVPEFSVAQSPGILRRAGRALLRGLSGTAAPDTPEALTLDQVIDRVQGSLSIRPIGISHGIRIGVMSTSPERAAAIANTLPELYISQRYDQSLHEITRAAGLLEERTRTWRAEVAKLEAEVVARQSEILELEQSNRLLTEQMLLDTSTDLNKLRRERVALEARTTSMRALIQSEGPQRAAAVATSDEIARLREAMTDARILRDERAVSLGPENTASKAADAHLRAMTDLMTQSVTEYLSALEDELAIVIAHEAALTAQLHDATGLSIAIEKQSIELGQLQLEAAAARRVYEDLLHRLQETRAAQAFGSAGARIIDRADVPVGPARPRKTLTVAGSVVFGIFLGLSIIIARQVFTSRVRSVRELEQLCRLPVLAAFPGLSIFRRLASPRRRYMLGGDAEQRRDGIQRLRAAITAGLDTRAPARTCALTSTVADAGQTAIGLELARSCAGHGIKVLLIDADVTRGALTKASGLRDRKGFSDALLRQVTADQAIAPHPGGTFDIMPVGTAATETNERIGEPAVKLVLNAVRRNYDLVLFDAGAWSDASATSLIAGIADGTVVVVDVAGTPRQIVRSVVRGLERIGANSIGAIANKTSFEHAGLVPAGAR